MKILSRNEKMLYAVVSLIMYMVYSFDCGHYYSEIFDFNTGIWWHCDDDEITKIINFPEGVCIREKTKRYRKKFKAQKCLLWM